MGEGSMLVHHPQSPVLILCTLEGMLFWLLPVAVSRDSASSYGGSGRESRLRDG